MLARKGSPTNLSVPLRARTHIPARTAAEMDDESAKRVFKSRTLRGKLLGALQAARSGRGEEVISSAVIDASELRSALAEMGDEVSSKDLFPLVQQADPDGDGVVTLPRFLSVIEQRREQLKREREQALLTTAYIALGGDLDREKNIKSALLMDVAQDFVGAGAAKSGIQGVVKHKMKGVQAVLDMGGALDSDEEEELKDTSSLSYEELQAFAAALRANGADPVARPDDDDHDGVVTAGPSPDSKASVSAPAAAPAASSNASGAASVAGGAEGREAPGASTAPASGPPAAAPAPACPAAAPASAGPT